MRYFLAFFSLLLMVGLVVVLNISIGSLPPLGKLLDPVNGWAANAENASKDFSQKTALKGLKAPVTIWLEDRLVPHLRAANNHDLYFTQGFIHASFRLWQMEFQTHAAAGRLGEIVGEKWIVDEKTGKEKNIILEIDRGQRRKGMVYGAMQSLKAMESEPRTKEMLDAYTAGINAYIQTLQYRTLPLEYKLLNYKPEPWTNLKCALLLKYMADDLTGYTEDFQFSVLRDYLSQEQFEKLYPQRLSISYPVIPKAIKFDAASLKIPSPPGDSVWVHFLNLPKLPSYPPTQFQPRKNITFQKNEPAFFNQYSDGIGSNNWAVSGSRNINGSAILANDPHLGLNLPSLWFEMQLSAPDVNVYGVSLPGAPGVVVGFNDSITWGVTNNYRDVKDFYEIQRADDDHYFFEGEVKSFRKQIETIHIKGKEDFLDTVFYTLHGPVIFDARFDDPISSKKTIALQWMAHRPTNELLALYLLNRAKDYPQFVNAISHFKCPAQNFAYADRAGNIAIWGQGQFINKWKDQGRYVMQGNTSATLWGDDIPVSENPHVLNPEQGYVASANQIQTDENYPYWYNGYFYDFRAIAINAFLQKTKTVTISKMMQMQNNTWSPFAEEILPQLLPHVVAENEQQKHALQLLKVWNYDLDPNSEAATVFQLWWDAICSRFNQYPFAKEVTTKSEYVFHQLTLPADSLTDRPALVNDAFHQIFDSLQSLQNAGKSKWYLAKGTSLTHLARIPAFGYFDIFVGGWGNTINAMKRNHGPSWRMVVEMNRDSIAAFGVYPGGQSGNPGSKFYGNFITHWQQGDYYPLRFFDKDVSQKPASIPFVISFKP